MTKPATTMVSVYDGRECIGFILRRLWTGEYALGFEAFDAREHSLGIFGSQAAAAAEVWRRARAE